MSILFRKGDAAPIRLEETRFERETLLQEYIHQNPETVPLYEIKSDVQLLILAREFPTASGPIDALAMDSEGELYIVETKLFKNPDKRAVIAQVLDYGAALWKHATNFSDFLADLDERAQRNWGMNLSQKIAVHFGINKTETSRLFDIARDNLDDGIMRFVVLMDRTDDRLRDLVLYVNQNSQFSVYAVELECYRHEENEIIIPRVYGAEVKKDLGVSGPTRRTWTAEETLEEARRSLSNREFEAYRELYEFSDSHANSISFGTGVTRGSFGPVYEDICPRTVFTLRTTGVFSWNFLGWFDDSAAERQFADELFRRVAAPFNLSEADRGSFPQFATDDWVSRVDLIKEALRDAVAAYRSGGDTTRET